MKYRYEGLNKDAVTVSGIVEAVNEAEARELAESQGECFVTELDIFEDDNSSCGEYGPPDSDRILDIYCWSQIGISVLILLFTLMLFSVIYTCYNFNMIYLSLTIVIVTAFFLYFFTVANVRIVIDRLSGKLQLYNHRVTGRKLIYEVGIDRISSIVVARNSIPKGGVSVEACLLLDDEIYISILDPNIRTKTVRLSAEKIAGFLQIKCELRMDFYLSLEQLKMAEAESRSLSFVPPYV